jgi:hypothetical protein
MSTKQLIYIEAMVFWAVALCSIVVGNQYSGGHAASTFRVEVHGQGDVSNPLLCSHGGS